MFAMARYATIGSFDNSDSIRSAWVDAGCALPRHELKMALARPLSLNARLRKSRDCERTSSRSNNCECGSTSKNYHGAARTSSVAQPPRGLHEKALVGLLAATLAHRCPTFSSIESTSLHLQTSRAELKTTQGAECARKCKFRVAEQHAPWTLL
jgi:hypothetical protein